MFAKLKKKIEEQDGGAGDGNRTLSPLKGKQNYSHNVVNLLAHCIESHKMSLLL